jgi:class 3 adenylate cyclase
LPQRDDRPGTPEHLARKIRAAGAALAGERKHVTVLFADVQGSMDLAASLARIVREAVAAPVVGAAELSG